MTGVQTCALPIWVHILKHMEICNKINLALRLANPKWKGDISNWGRKVPIVQTNSHGYEDDHLNITYMICSTLNFDISYLCSALSGDLVFNLMHSWHDEASYFPVPMVNIFNYGHLYTLNMNFYMTILYNDM